MIKRKLLPLGIALLACLGLARLTSAGCNVVFDCVVCHRLIFLESESCNYSSWVCDNGDYGAEESCMPY